MDIIYGGFPCQDISTAGRGAGLEGERSGLFFEIVRLAEEIKPRFLFLENVPAIRTRGLDRVVEELAHVGYDCRWGALSAFDVGAPHKRERWFLLAYCNGERFKKTWPELKTTGFARNSIENVADPNGKGLERRNFDWECSNQRIIGTGGQPIKTTWGIEPSVGRLAHGIPNRVDRIKCLGNAVVPQQAKEAFERLSGIKGVTWNP